MGAFLHPSLTSHMCRLGGCHVDLTSAYLPPVLLGAHLAAGALRCRIQTERLLEYRDVVQRHREADAGHPGGAP